MELTLIVAVVLTFFIFLTAMGLHESYIKVTLLYDETMEAMSKREAKLEDAITQSTLMSESFAMTIKEGEGMCGKDSTKECDLCDDKCLFRREVK